MSTKQDAGSEARAIEEPVAAKRAWGPVLRGEARARLARYDAAVKREADLCAADPKRPRGQLLLAVDREVFAAMLARLDTLAPLAEAAARVRETGKGAETEHADFKAADAAWVAQGRPGGPLFDARQTALKCSNATRLERLRANDALLALARGER